MSAFDPEGDLGQDRGFRLLLNTPVTLFYRRNVLEETSTWLAEHEYQITVLDAASWSAEADLHRDIAQALSFPDYYGRTIDALNDPCVTLSAKSTAGIPTQRVLCWYSLDTMRSPRAALGPRR